MVNDYLERILNEGDAEIVFDKVDGTRRIMRCTKNKQYIDEHTKDHKRKTERVINKTAEVLTVFDIEKNDWRTIRPDSIISFRQLEHEARADRV